MKRYFALTTCDMLVILFIMKYHSVLPAVIANKTANPKVKFHKYVFVVFRGTFSCVLFKITGCCSFEKDIYFIKFPSVPSSI